MLSLLFIYPVSYTLMLLKHWVDEKEKEVRWLLLPTISHWLNISEGSFEDWVDEKEEEVGAQQIA